MEELTKKERIIRTFNYEPLDRMATSDIIHNLRLFEYLAGGKINTKNAEDLTCIAISRVTDLIRHVAIPYNLEISYETDEDDFVYRVKWYTKELVKRPFKTLVQAKEQVKKDIYKIRKSIENRIFCRQASFNLNLFGEDCKTPKELNEKFKRIQNKMDGTVMMLPECIDSINIATTRYGWDIFVYLYHDYTELISEYLDTLCDYELFRIDSFEGPNLSPISLYSVTLGGVNGLLVSPSFLDKEVFPRAKKVIDNLKERGYKIIGDFEGDVRSIMDRIVGLGIDGYGPVEKKSNMDVIELKEKYPKLVLQQTVDDIQILNHGSKEDVINETKKFIDYGFKYGGFFLGSSGVISDSVKVENAVTMFDTIKKYSYFK